MSILHFGAAESVGRNTPRCFARNWTILPVLALTAGCGSGSGGGGGIVSTTPPPTQSAIIAAPQDASTNASLDGPLQSQTFATLTVRASATQSASALVLATSSGPGTGATIGYDAASNTYAITSPTQSASGASPDMATMTPADAAMTEASSSTGCVTQFCSGLGYLSRLGTNRPTTDPYIVYHYVGFAGWWSNAASGSNTVYVQNEAVFGIPTPANAIPTTGTGSYTLDLQGYEATTPLLGTSGGHTLTPQFAGGGTATLDFGAGTYSMTGSFTGVTDYKQTTFSSSGKLLSGANGFGGTFTFADSGQFSGTLNGWLFGPAAQELGAVFSASSADGRQAVGTIVGHK